MGRRSRAEAGARRGSQLENANRQLRDYFPKGTELSIHPPEHLLAVENELTD